MPHAVSRWQRTDAADEAGTPHAPAAVSESLGATIRYLGGGSKEAREIAAPEAAAEDDGMIEEAKLEAAMNYLATTDEVCAELKTNVARSEYMAKVAESMAFNLLEGPMEARKNEARVATSVKDAWESHFQATQAYEIVRARRERAVLTVDVWRSQNANRRQAA